MKRRFIRQNDELDPETLIVRGGELDQAVLREAALRNWFVYGTYGISVLALRRLSLDELAQRPPLVRFGVLTLLTARELLEAGLRLEATGQNPLHYDIGFDDLEGGLEAILSCDHDAWRNPYHER